MPSAKSIYRILLGVNILAVMTLTAYRLGEKNSHRLLSQIQSVSIQSDFLTATTNAIIGDDNESDASTTIQDSDSYTFTDPIAAYHLLRQLDVFSTIPLDHSAPKRSPSFFGLQSNDNYCDQHRAALVNNPDFIFNQNNFMSDYYGIHLLRKTVIPAIGADAHPDIGLTLGGKAKISANPNMRTDISTFFTRTVLSHKRVIGQQFSCLTQSSNHIPGFDILNRKDLIGEASVIYTEKYASRPQCFNNDKFFPKTWVLTIKEQCDAFFEEFNSQYFLDQKAEKGVVYIRKIGAGAHEASGIFPVDDKEEAKIREFYQDGALCGKVKKNNVMQSFIHNPLLLKGRKFDFGIFLLVASSNPIMAYYHDGYLRVSLNSYDPNSTEKQGLLTNIAVAERAFNKARTSGKFNGMTLKQVKEETYWTFIQLQEYLFQEGVVTDPEWLENYLRPEMKKALIHLTRMSQGPITRISSLYKLYGLDFMLDDNLNLWFIEANARPGLNGWMPRAHKQFTQLLTDTFEIVSGLLRSRTKRIINYINNMTAGDDTVYELDDIVKRREEFSRVSQNRFEPEFEPSTTNGFQLIIDENFEGPERYQGLIDAECL